MAADRRAALSNHETIGEAPSIATSPSSATPPSDADVRHLRWLKGKLGDDLRDAVVVTTGRGAYRRPDGIAVVPAALLGP